MSLSPHLKSRDVFIVDGNRTPFLKAKGKPGPFTASDLAVYAGRELLARQPFKPQDLDEVIIGCMMPNPDEVNIARVISLRLGCGKKVPAFTVQRNCASGLQSIDNAAQLIQLGRADLILAGGTDAMSHSPLLFNKKMVNWLSDFQASKSFKQKFLTALKFRPQYLSPIIALLKGLTDATIGLNMGQTAEILADKFNISREEMDQFALQSHTRLANAVDQQHLAEISTLYDSFGNYYDKDDGLRRDSTLEKLASLKPFFDKKYGRVTAANSSQITDGAAMLILASKDAVEKYQLPVLAKIVDTQWAGVEPRQMGLGPAHAIPPLLQRQQLSLDNIDCLEINEAFASQVLACTKALACEKYCKEELGWDKAVGLIDPSKLNVDGGAIAIGHPIGASGTRVLLHTANVLKRSNKQWGIASLCIGGGQGGAMLIENVSFGSGE